MQLCMSAIEAVDGILNLHMTNERGEKYILRMTPAEAMLFIAGVHSEYNKALEQSSQQDETVVCQKVSRHAR